MLLFILESFFSWNQFHEFLWKNWFHEKKILSTTIPSTLLIVYPMLTLVEVVACLLARFGVVFCSKAGLSIQVQYTPISRSEVLCYDFVHRKETDRFWSHCKSSSRIVVNKNKLVCWPALKMIFSLFLCFPCAASFICAVCLKITDMPPCTISKLNFKVLCRY